MNLGLIGCGRHGSRYASHLLAGDVPGARLAAVSRRNEAAGRAFADEHAIRFHSGFEEMAADPGIDGVIVCLPPDLHPAAVLAALAGGKAVLVEKPLASDLAGALAIEKAAHRKQLMVAQTLRFNSIVRAMEAGREEIGPLHGFSASQRYEPLPLEWIEDPVSGGTLRVTGVHSFDLARHLTGAEAVRASCEIVEAPDEDCGDAAPRTSGTSRGTAPRERVDRSFAAVLRMEPGPILATIDNSRGSGGRAGRIELVGERGSLVGDHVLGELFLLQGGKATAVRVAPPVQTVRECLRAFLAAARGEVAFAITATDGRRAVEMVEACRKAAYTGKSVRIGGSHRV